MRLSLVTAAAAVSLLVMPTGATAQALDVGITGLGLLSLQSTDDTYQSPYLDEPIGGLAPGFGAGVSVTAEGLAVVGEITTARFELEQEGRVIPGNCIRIPQSSQCTSTTRLHDSLLTGLVGYVRSDGPTRMLFLGGISTLLDSATTNGVSIHDGVDVGIRLGVTAGVDVLIASTPRIAFSVGARYTYLPRTDQEIEIGAGASVLRILGGLRVRLN